MAHKVAKCYVNFSTLALVGARITTMLEKLVIQHCQHFLGAWMVTSLNQCCRPQQVGHIMHKILK
jgi:hypothetical protein